MVDSSKESVSVKEFDNKSQKGLPTQESFLKVNVLTTALVGNLAGLCDFVKSFYTIAEKN